LKKSKVFFRADGDTQIGLGHLVRCIALAHMLKNAFQIIFFCKRIPSQAVNELSENNFGLVQIEDESAFFKKVANRDIVVLDGYNFDIEYQNQIKAIGCKLVCIDDTHEKEFAADLIINHSPGIKPEEYKARPYTKFALGFSYALLRKSFLEHAKIKREEKKAIKTLFICFGGSDFKNLTEQTLSAATPFHEFSTIIAVTGSAYANLDSLEKAISRDKRIIHYHGLEETEMLNVLKQADLAIVPASGILFEVLTFQIPIITGSYVSNQSVFITEIVKYKQVINSIDFSAVNLTNAIETALHAEIEYDNLIDGYSDERIITLFKSLQVESV